MMDSSFCEEDVDEEKARRSILVTNVPGNLTYSDVIIHFQKPSNGGGKVDSGMYHKPGDRSSVVITFEDPSTVETAIDCRQVLGTTEVTVQRYPLRTRTPEMFSLIIAKLDPSYLKVSGDELNKLLFQAQKKTKMTFVETCDGFLVTGTLDQINETCLFLSYYAKPRLPRPTRRKTDDENPNDPDCNDQSDDEADSNLKPVELDVLPKLMTIIHNKVETIERKYTMKIDWKLKEGKACLSPSGNDTELFYQGKEEFISLYMKEFQDLKEMDFKLDGVDKTADLDRMLKELMTEFSVVIEKTGEKNLHIFGKEDRVSQVIQRLKAKFGNHRQTIRPANGRDDDQMPKPDIHATLSKTLDNGIVVSVHQGDITKTAVDVIVNAANERLVHGGGVAGAIVRQGGQEIQHESDDIIQQSGSVPVGQVAHTGPGSLPCKRIFHAVGPQWKVHGQEQSRQLIFQACRTSLDMASKNKMSSIALPEISSEMYGVPKSICAEMMFAAAESFSVEAPSDNQLKDIRFINMDSPTYEAFRREFQNRYAMKNVTDADLTNADGNTNVTFPSPVGHKVTEMPRVISNLQGRSKSEEWISTEDANVQAMERDEERRKRAEAAARREKQGKKNEKAKDEGKPAECETMVKSSPNRGFLRGFRTREGERKAPHEMKSKENIYTDNKHAFKKDVISIKRNVPDKGKKETDKIGLMKKEKEKLKEKKKTKKEEAEIEEKEKETTERAKISLQDQVGPKTFFDLDNTDGKSTAICKQDVMKESNHLSSQATSSKENLDAVDDKAEGQEYSNKKVSVQENISIKAANHNKAVADSKEDEVEGVRMNDASDLKAFEGGDPTCDISLIERVPPSMESNVPDKEEVERINHASAKPFEGGGPTWDISLIERVPPSMESNVQDKVEVERINSDRKPFEGGDPTWDNSLTETGPTSMESFVVLSMPFPEHIGLSRASRASGSNDESNESIVILDKDIESRDSPSPHNNNKNKSIKRTGPETDKSRGVYSSVKRNVDVTREDDDEEIFQSPMTQNKDEKVENSFTGFKKVADSSVLEQEVTSVSSAKYWPECGLCFNTIDPDLALRICNTGHVVCKTCLNGMQSSECKSVCPTCHIHIHIQPQNGQMKSRITKGGLPGYESCGTLYVDYEFPGGIQGPLHPNPGSLYDKLSRRTFLPDNKEGREVLDLLEKAFDAGMLFTVGKSTINGKDNQIIFQADIEHKTNVTGGPSGSGYPDPDYLDRVKKQLKAKGIE